MYYISEMIPLSNTTATKRRHRQFLPARRYASAGYSDRNVSVCPSRAGIAVSYTHLTLPTNREV